MKTYILREPKPVEPQRINRHRAPQFPPLPCPPVAAGPALCIGLDVHNDSIAVSLASSDSTEVRRYGIIGGTHDRPAAAEPEVASGASGRGVEVLFPDFPDTVRKLKLLTYNGAV